MLLVITKTQIYQKKLHHERFFFIFNGIFYYNALIMHPKMYHVFRQAGFLAVILLLSANAMKAQQPQQTSAWIKKQASGEHWSFTAFFQNDSVEVLHDLTYKLHGHKKGGGGTSSISQSGPFDAPRGEKISLSSITLDEPKNGHIELTLEIWQKNRRIGHDSIHIKH